MADKFIMPMFIMLLF